MSKAPSKTKSLNDWTRKQLMKLPFRKWDDGKSTYDSLLILSSRRKHDSGWAEIVIIGVRNFRPIEICTICSDDIEWKLPAPYRFGPRLEWSTGQFRMDCCFASGALHAWQRDATFRVGMALSSIEIELVEKAGRK